MGTMMKERRRRRRVSLRLDCEAFRFMFTLLRTLERYDIFEAMPLSTPSTPSPISSEALPFCPRCLVRLVFRLALSLKTFFPSQTTSTSPDRLSTSAEAYGTLILPYHQNGLPLSSFPCRVCSILISMLPGFGENIVKARGRFVQESACFTAVAARGHPAFGIPHLAGFEAGYHRVINGITNDRN